MRFIPACAGSAADRRLRSARAAVHPRVCGERELSGNTDFEVSGSSPRVRGAQLQIRRVSRRRRFIPACAGSAGRAQGSGGLRTVHPRVCGERGVRCAGFVCLAVHPRVCGERNSRGTRRTHRRGSSPRVRGARTICCIFMEQIRFIPACAGSAPERAFGLPGSPVHPRVCGERGGHAAPPASRAGSSPRVRGALLNAPSGCPDLPFIPACAGSAGFLLPVLRARPVHPRVCGERPTGESLRLVRVRFIPACAGSASEHRSDILRPTVHPRVCGERDAQAQLRALKHGSSPRVRGAHSVRQGRYVFRRFIPACAGSAHLRLSTTGRRTVHPRVCGERASCNWSL